MKQIHKNGNKFLLKQILIIPLTVFLSSCLMNPNGHSTKFHSKFDNSQFQKAISSDYAPLMMAAHASGRAEEVPKVSKPSGKSENNSKRIGIVGPKLNLSKSKMKGKPPVIGAKATVEANKGAIEDARSDQFLDSMMTYNYSPGAIYRIYCAPLKITDIILGQGETTISIASGDTIRWTVSKTYSGTASNLREHIIIKPQRSGLESNVMIATNLRSYHLLLESDQDSYMTAVSWRYPNNDPMIQNFSQAANQDFLEASKPFDFKKVDSNYRIFQVSGERPDWFPEQVFSFANKTYIHFSSKVQRLPALFIFDRANRLVNYRVVGNYYVVDYRFRAAKLILDSGSRKRTIIGIEHIGR